MNHCIECGRRVSAGQTSPTRPNATRCLICQVAHDMRGWRYPASQDKQALMRERDSHANANRPLSE